MELDITTFYNDADTPDYSASIMEKGRLAGSLTWAAALRDGPEWNLLDTDDKRDAFRAHVKGFGAWSEEEIAAWSPEELNALCVQMIAGDMREAGMDGFDFDWAEYESDDNDNRGCISRGDDGRVYYYLGD